MKISARFDKARGAVLAVAVTLVLLTMSALDANARTFRLTAVSGYTPVASWVKLFQEFYIPEVEARLEAAGSNHKIKWIEGFSGTVVKPRGELEAVETGIADVGIVVTPFHVDKLPLYNVAYVTPFVTSDLGLVLKTVDELTGKFPEMRAHWEKNNQVFLATVGTVDSYQIVTNVPATTPADLIGLKLGGAGPNLLWLEGLGAIGVNSNLGDFYNGIKNGVFDGCIVWAEAAGNFKLYEVAPYYLQADMGAVNSFALTVNKDVWEDLPEEVQTVMAEAAVAYRDESARYVTRTAAAGIQAYRDNGGVITALTDEDRRNWAMGLSNIAQEWAGRLEEAGLPARAILSEYMAAMRAAGQPIARQWDKE